VSNRPFHVVDHSDVALLVDHVAEKYEYSHMFAIGFSLGGNFVSRYLMHAGKVLMKQLCRLVLRQKPVTLWMVAGHAPDRRHECLQFIQLP
jgi:predicted alpha/beta-fold hydrolase